MESALLPVSETEALNSEILFLMFQTNVLVSRLAAKLFTQLWGQSWAVVEADQQSWESEASIGPFSADLTQWPCSVKGPKRWNRGRERIKLLNLT